MRYSIKRAYSSPTQPNPRCGIAALIWSRALATAAPAIRHAMHWLRNGKPLTSPADLPKNGEFVSKTKFGKLVVQGGLTTGLLHALVAMDMPGPGTVFLSQNWKFTAPVYIDDTITAHAEVLSVHATKPVTQLAIRVVRQSGEVVLEGEAWCYTFAAE